MPRRRPDENPNEEMFPPVKSPEAREQQLISLATDLVEKRLRNGTASSQETVHFLKLATTQTKLELELTKAQVELAKAKKENLQLDKDIKKMYEDAVKAMQEYSGNGSE